ncbi:hypothetical protein L6R49_27350, partial [Myxococcota bacterium]|nr:hypothetical protein [Myxococcota bacterium]
TAAVAPAAQPVVAPASVAAPAPAPSTLSELDLSVSGGRVIVRGVVSGAGQKAAGLLIEDDGVCEYRLKLSRTDLSPGIGSMPVASPLAKRLNVSSKDGNTTVTLLCTPGAGQPQLSASPSGFTLTFAPK